MRLQARIRVGAAGLLLWAIPAMGTNILLRGKVLMEDGSPPGKGITVEKFCYSGASTLVVANTAKTGFFLYNADVDAVNTLNNCVLRGALKGYDSTVVPISQLNFWSDPNLPNIILRVHDASLGADDERLTSDLFFQSSKIPPNVRAPWNNADKAIGKSNWAVAERELRIVAKDAPKLPDVWTNLGEVLMRLNRPEEAAEAFETSVTLDPKSVLSRLRLLRAYVQVKKWPEAESIAESLIQQKADSKYPEIYMHRAIARYNSGDIAGAEASMQEGIKRDTKHQLPRSEFVLGTILEAQGDFDGAREHMQRYLELDPRSADAAGVRDRMNNLGKNPASPVIATLAATDTTVDAAGEAWVPGGMKALAKMAMMPNEPAYQTFFEEYCRAIGREVSVGTTQGIPRFTQSLRTFLAAVTELIPLGEKHDDTVVIRISAGDPERRQQAKAVLALLGWTLEERDGKTHVEPGYRAQDALLQTVASALGIDQIAMQESLESGSEFQFEIVSENARLVGGNVWTQILIKDLVPAGGLPAVFATDTRIAKTCAGLNAMNADTAAKVMSAAGLRNLAAKDAEVLFRYSDTFSTKDGRVTVPGGAAAEPVWQKLVGANPRNPGDFFRTLIEKDAGYLAAFYATLARADAAHQRYFTESAERAGRFYQWFRTSPEMKGGVLQHVPAVQTEFLQGVPLDASGNIRFPGGQSAWFAGAEIPLNNPLLEALVPVARLEEKRGVALDAESAGLLARNHTQWAGLYSYFESLAGMGSEEFSVLAGFTESVARRSAAERNAVLGEWHALVELIARGAKAGTLDSAAAAKAFRQAAVDLAGDSHAAGAVALLRQLAGDGDLEEAVATNLLRLDGERRGRFGRSLELLRAPRISEGRADDVPVAMSAFVYAAALDPELLVLNEDPGLLRRHRFASDRGPMFVKAELHGAQDASGTHFSGGFAGFEDAAKKLMGGAKAAPRAPIVTRAAPQVHASGEDDEPAADFRSDSKLVEVYTTVTDDRGRYIDDLTVAQFTLTNGKEPQSIVAFEPQTSDLSVALLLDTTGSMADTIASLKRAAIKLIDSLRPGDSVAVYSFSDQVTELASYTTDRGVTKRAVMSARPFGNTALYDALARAGHELTGRRGKKVVIVFTDGRDTASVLKVDAAIERAKVAGVPVYTIAQGEAMDSPEVVRQLGAISKATGGVAFQVRNPDAMSEVFEKVAEDLSHGYLLYFQAPESEEHEWREISVGVVKRRDLRIRAREGYYP